MYLYGDIYRYNNVCKKVIIVLIILSITHILELIIYIFDASFTGAEYWPIFARIKSGRAHYGLAAIGAGP